jgi:ABC-2 type transport system ATP-binding protein
MPDPQSIVEVENLVFEYPGKRALHGVSFTINPGSVTALVGPNGAGKTTIMRCVAALDRPFSGRVRVGGIDTQHDPRGCHRLLSFLPDFFGLYEQLTVRQSLTFMVRIHEVPEAQVACAVQRAVADVQLEGYQDRIAAELSRGLRQRLAIAMAIIHRPRVLLLDEPASGLDPEGRHALSQLIVALRDSGITIVVSSHILSELENYSSEMLTCKDGRIIAHEVLSVPKEGRKRWLMLELIEGHEHALDMLRAAADVSDAAIADQKLRFMFTGSAEAQASLLRRLMDSGCSIVQFAEEERKLQDLYLAQVQAKWGKNE